MVKERVVVWGASGHARVVADILRLQGGYEIYGFLDDFDPAGRGTSFCGSQILGDREQLGPLAKSGIQNLIFGFGACAAKHRLARLARQHGFTFVTAVHPRAVIAEDVRIGGGAVIAAGAVVNAGASLGDNAIINTSASVDHECTIGAAVHICPGVHLGGRVRVDPGSWIGIGSIVKEGVTIGAGSIVGAGSLVLRDVPPRVVTFGSPATVRRRVNEDEPEIAG